MSNQQVKQHELDHPDFPDYVLVSSFLGAPVYQKRSDIIAGPTPRDSVQQAPQPELGGPVAALPHAPPVLASTAPQSPITAPAEPAGEEGLGAADVIPRPLMRFPNIAEGRAALGFTNSRWNYLYSRAQEIIVPFLDENPQTATTPLHLRAENHPDNLGRLTQEFPDLKRCEGNWGVKWVIKKARHAITVRGVSDRKWCSRSSLGDTPLESADETEKDEAEGTGDDTEDDPGASEDSRGPVDDNNTASSSTESLLPAGPPTAAKVDVPAWHKYMTPQYTQGRGPSIYGLTKPIVPFFEPAAGPPSMRHATADLDSDINTNIKKRAKRLPRPEIAPPRPMAPAVIVNPGVGTASASDAPTKPLGMSASLETPARPPIAALNAPKVARHVSTPVLFARGDGVGPMQIAYASVSDLRKRKITALEPAVSNDSQYNAQAAGGYPAPYTRGHAYHSSIENMPTQAGKTTPFSVLEVRTLHRARPQWNSANNYPRFDQLAGGSNGGAVNILNTEQKPGTRALNCGTHSDIAGVNNPNGRLGGPSGGQYYQNYGQGGPRVDSQQHHGFNPNGNPYATGRVPISNVVNHGGAHPSSTPNGNSNSSHNAGTTPPTTTLPSIHTLPGIHALPRLEPHHTLYSNAAANPRHAYSPNPTGSDGASTIPGRALPQPRRGGGPTHSRVPSWGTNPF